MAKSRSKLNHPTNDKDHKEQPQDKVTQENTESNSKTGETKHKVLILSTRGVTARFRHLMEDVLKLVPHSKKESKLDTKDKLNVVNEICELRNCNAVVLFEARKFKDLYLWIGCSPDGPSAKFLVSNIHTMLELNFPGNNLLYSRPIVLFDPIFEQIDYLKVIKQLLSWVFVSPKNHRKTKPFIDHVISFYYLDNRIWFRHYQLVHKKVYNSDTTSISEEKLRPELYEIGPRFVLDPIRVFQGCMEGSTLYENPHYVSPNEIRRSIKLQEGYKQRRKLEEKSVRKQRKEEYQLETDPIEDMFRKDQ
eukprot:jgi/Galph1/3115/GphlegSOOS_G1781.1